MPSTHERASDYLAIRLREELKNFPSTWAKRLAYGRKSLTWNFGKGHEGIMPLVFEAIIAPLAKLSLNHIFSSKGAMAVSN